MSCPIHVWAPLLAAAVPVAHVVRDRVRIMRDRIAVSRTPEVEAPRELKRWAPVGSPAARESSPE